MESHKRQKTKKSLENAMVKLLSKQSFDQITTVKLTQEAEISRSSFYTHYKDKFDMIDHYQDRLFHTLDYIFDKHEGHLTFSRQGFLRCTTAYLLKIRIRRM